jgi:hypothetical protein
MSAVDCLIDLRSATPPPPPPPEIHFLTEVGAKVMARCKKNNSKLSLSGSVCVPVAVAVRNQSYFCAQQSNNGLKNPNLIIGSTSRADLYVYSTVKSGTFVVGG